MKTIEEDVANRLSLTRAVLDDVAAGNGQAWKEAVGELQDGEIVIWVLLYEDVDLVETHAAFRKVLQPHREALEPLQVVLYYEVAINDRAFGAKLSGNDAVFSAGDDGKMEVNWYPRTRGLPSVLKSRDSSRTI